MNTEGPYYGNTALVKRDIRNWGKLRRTNKENAIWRGLLLLAIGCALCFAL